MIGIYKITNLINGKSYIGQSITIEKRIDEHYNEAFDPKDDEYNSLLHKAIRKYGKEQFYDEVLEECLKEDLNTKEKYYISHYNTCVIKGGIGYNLDEGGNSGHIWKLTEEDLKSIIDLLQNTDQRQKDIAYLFNISVKMVSDINVGRWRRQPYLKYPIRERRYTSGKDQSIDRRIKKSN